VNRHIGAAGIAARTRPVIESAHPQPDVAIVRRNHMSLLMEELARDRMREMQRNLETARRVRLARAARRAAR
jgi:hypothetical protein